MARLQEAGRALFERLVKQVFLLRSKGKNGGERVLVDNAGSATGKITDSTGKTTVFTPERAPLFRRRRTVENHAKMSLNAKLNSGVKRVVRFLLTVVRFRGHYTLNKTSRRSDTQSCPMSDNAKLNSDVMRVVRFLLTVVAALFS